MTDEPNRLSAVARAHLQQARAELAAARDRASQPESEESQK